MGRPFDPGELDAATLRATTEGGACELCGRERLHTLGGQSTYDACTAVAGEGRAAYLYYDGDTVREAGYSGVGDPRLDALGFTLREGRAERRAGPFGCEGVALRWAHDFEEDHPELWWTSLGFEENEEDRDGERNAEADAEEGR